MNENIIKIGVPFLVLVGIIAWIVSTQKPINQLSSEMHISAFDFKTYVSDYIADSIRGKQKVVAQKAYAHVYDIIKTEAAIVQNTQSGSSQLLSPEDANALYEYSFKTYFAIFESEANQLFSGSIWGDLALKDIQSEAESLLGCQGIASGKDSLNHYIKYVSGYYAAVKLINNSKYCSKKSSYDHYRNQAQQYQGYPYHNNSNLNRILSTVTNNAQSGWRKAIIDEVNSICNTYKSDFNTYQNFYDNYYTPELKRIQEYENTIGSTLSCRGDLNRKNTEVRDYYTQLEAQRNAQSSSPMQPK